MRRPRLIALALSCCALTAALVWAGDRQSENQSAKQFTSPVPVKQFDLGKIDTSKPPVEPVPAKPPDQVQTPKPTVRYRAPELAPEGAEIVLEVPDLARARRAARASPLGRLMAPDVLGPIWDKRITARLRKLPPAGEGLPSGDALVDLVSRVSELLSGEVVAALYPPAEGAGGRRFLLVAELEGARRTAFLDTLEDFKALAGLSRDTTRDILSKEEFEFQRLTATKNGLTVTWGFVGNHLVMEVGRGQAKPGKQLYADLVLAAAVSRGDKSLAREAARAEQMAMLVKDADCYLRADPRALAELLAAGKGGRQGAAAAGLEGVKYLAAALRLESGAAREKLFAAVDPASRLGKLLPKHAPAEGLCTFMPLDACYFEIERLEPGAAAQAYELFKASLSDEARKKLEERAAEIDRKSNLSLEKDILPAFAGEIASAYTVRSAGALPEIDLVVVIQPEDLDKLKKALSGLERAVPVGEFKSEDYLGAQIRYLEEPKEKSREGTPAATEPFALRLRVGGRGPGTLDGGAPTALTSFKAYAVFGQNVILGTSFRAVKMAMRQKDPAQHTSSILDKPDFKAARSALGGAPANELSYGYADLHRVGEVLYALVGASGQFTELPPADRVLEEMTGMAWSLRREKQGVSVEVFSPVGLLPLSAAVFAEATLDAVDAAAVRERERHEAKLKAIWRGMELFATEFGRYPLGLSELYPTYVPNASCFLTPDQEDGEAKITIAKAEEVEAKTDYRYISGRAPNSVGSTLLIYAAKPNARGKHWCLFVNGKVRDVEAKVMAETLGAKKPAGGQTPAGGK